MTMQIHQIQKDHLNILTRIFLPLSLKHKLNAARVCKIWDAAVDLLDIRVARSFDKRKKSFRVIKTAELHVVYRHLALSTLLQKRIIQKREFNGAIDLLLQLNKKEYALIAFIKAGCESVSLFPHSTLEDIKEVRHHPFIEALKNNKSLPEMPLAAISHFLIYLVNRVLGINNLELSFENWLHDEEHIFRREVAREWLSIFPKNFDFPIALDGVPDLINYYLQLPVDVLNQQAEDYKKSFFPHDGVLRTYSLCKAFQGEDFVIPPLG